MCGGSAPPVVQAPDPQVAADKAAAEAAAKANAETAASRRARRTSALSTGAGLADTGGSALSYGKTTLGA